MFFNRSERRFAVYLLAFAVGIIAVGFLSSIGVLRFIAPVDQFLTDFYANFGTELVSIALTVLVIDRLADRRADALKSRIIEEVEQRLNIEEQQKEEVERILNAAYELEERTKQFVQKVEERAKEFENNLSQVQTEFGTFEKDARIIKSDVQRLERILKKIAKDAETFQKKLDVPENMLVQLDRLEYEMNRVEVLCLELEPRFEAAIESLHNRFDHLEEFQSIQAQIIDHAFKITKVWKKVWKNASDEEKARLDQLVNKRNTFLRYRNWP